MRPSDAKYSPGPWRVESFRDFASIMAGEDEICYIDEDDLLAKIKEVIKMVDGKKQ